MASPGMGTTDPTNIPGSPSGEGGRGLGGDRLKQGRWREQKRGLGWDGWREGERGGERGMVEEREGGKEGGREGRRRTGGGGGRQGGREGGMEGEKDGGREGGREEEEVSTEKPATHPFPPCSPPLLQTRLLLMQPLPLLSQPFLHVLLIVRIIKVIKQRLIERHLTARLHVAHDGGRPGGVHAVPTQLLLERLQLLQVLRLLEKSRDGVCLLVWWLGRGGRTSALLVGEGLLGRGLVQDALEGGA